MATNIANDVSFIGIINSHKKANLGGIRDWDNLTAANFEDNIFIKGFTSTQMSNATLKAIAGLELYEWRNNYLHKLNHLVPEHSMLSGLLWSPLRFLIPVTIENWNHNFFGIQERIDVKFIPTEIEETAIAHLAFFKDVYEYASQNLAIRLTHLQYTILGDECLILGAPILSIQGKTYWNRHHHLLPTGYDFNLPILANTLENKYNEKKDAWLLWDINGTYTKIAKTQIQSLRLSSLKKATKLINQ